MKDKICIFAGTTEGRQLASLLKDAAALTVCVATEYGEIMLDGIDGLDVRTGRLDEQEMERFFTAEGFDLVIDATHPYAETVTENIASAAAASNTHVMRILRDTDKEVKGAVYVDTVAEAKDWLSEREGNILLTTGAKELGAFAGLDMQRVWARVLPFVSSIEACASAGIQSSHIIAAQGPFSYEMNLAQLRTTGAKYIVTKSSGKNGGFEEKINAAKAAGATPVIIGAPVQKQGFSMDEAVAALGEKYAVQKRRISIIGIGPGGAEYLTAAAKNALAGCDAVIGAASVTQALSMHKLVFNEYLPQKVCEVLEAHPSVRRPAIVMRGDTGFFSGAKKLKAALGEEDVTVIPGIASCVLFAAKLGVSWDDAAMVSVHGRENNIVRTVSVNAKTFVLTGGGNTPALIFGMLCEYGLGGLFCAVGERLSYDDEKVTRGTAEELKDLSCDPLSIIYIENNCPEKCTRIGIPDEEFVRGNVPITKAEVRAVSVARLSPEKDSVVWDVGAGTGSVTIECALRAGEGTVYAIEKKPEAAELVRQNAIKFRTDNVRVIEGSAPEALSDLPAPTHVFIGGTSGELKSIIALILNKNPDAAIVINAVTLETQSEALECAKVFRFDTFDAVCVSAVRALGVGRYHMTAAQNPVWIYYLRGGNADA